MNDYYDPDGLSITLDEWTELFGRRRADEDRSWWQRRTEVGDATVSTVWLGMNHNWGDGPPLYFETMIFGGPLNEYQWRWSSKEQAWAEHDRIVQALHDGREADLKEQGA